MPSSSSSFAANNILSKEARCRNQLGHCSYAPVPIRTHHQGFGQRRTELPEVPTSATQSYAAPFTWSQAMLSSSYIRGRTPRCPRFQHGAGSAGRGCSCPVPTPGSPMRWPKRQQISTLGSLLLRASKNRTPAAIRVHVLIPSTTDQVPQLRPPISLMPQTDRFILHSVSDCERLPDINLVLSLITKVKKNPNKPFFSITLRASRGYFRL